MIRYYLLAIALVALDQLTKWAVSTYMVIGETIPVIQNILHLTSHRNRGAAFGILQDQRWFFIVITTVVVIGIAVYIRRIYRDQRLLSYGLSLVLGGALGNFIDRAVSGEVVDMFELGFIDFPIFNAADCFIVVGAIIIFLHALLDGKRERAGKQA